MTNDFIDDAADVLDQSLEPYIIIVGRGQKLVLTSNFGEDNLEVLETWLHSGHWNLLLKDHIKEIKS